MNSMPVEGRGTAGWRSRRSQKGGDSTAEANYSGPRTMDAQERYRSDELGKRQAGKPGDDLELGWTGGDWI